MRSWQSWSRKEAGAGPPTLSASSPKTRSPTRSAPASSRSADGCTDGQSKRTRQSRPPSAGAVRLSQLLGGRGVERATGDDDAIVLARDGGREQSVEDVVKHGA